VVEDEEGIRTEVLDTLMAVGHRVEAAADADAALARLGQGGIDVVLTDLALRDRSGLQLASAVKKRSPGTAVVLLTGWGRRLHEARLRESGVDVMLVKPLQPDRIRGAVADALHLRLELCAQCFQILAVLPAIGVNLGEVFAEVGVAAGFVFHQSALIFARSTTPDQRVSSLLTRFPSRSGGPPAAFMP